MKEKISCTTPAPLWEVANVENWRWVPMQKGYSQKETEPLTAGGYACSSLCLGASNLEGKAGDGLLQGADPGGLHFHPHLPTVLRHRAPSALATLPHSTGRPTQEMLVCTHDVGVAMPGSSLMPGQLQAVCLHYRPNRPLLGKGLR